MPLDIERMSTCLLEVDALESDILNKGEIKGRQTNALFLLYDSQLSSRLPSCLIF